MNHNCIPESVSFFMVDCEFYGYERRNVLIGDRENQGLFGRRWA